MCVAQRAAEEWSVLSVRELLECGLSLDEIDGRVRRGQLHRRHQGVYAIGHPNLPVEGVFLAAVKASGPTAALSHYAAAAHWGFVAWDDRRPEVTVLGDWTHRDPGIRAHRTRFLDAIDLRTHKGIRVTSPARTLADLAPLLAYNGLRRAVRQAQGMHLVSVPQLIETMNRLGPRRGTRNLRKILSTGPAPTSTEMEDLVLDLILGGGLEHPDVNKPLVLDGRRVKPDFRWPEQRLVIEADGAAWHDNPVAREDDAERQALLEARGDRVLRVTWEQAVARPTQTLSRIRAAGAPPA
jgi:very-short-patch-repair endonuclease